ncbi:C45 family autoproteolytic acyltransferase/hydolase [Marinisporobacter balticus]|uniref:Putative choloylglycine hydrolase n=1 Tax=Marinisporobacter balticus TaxID=2018667 RepID=A0A4R2KU38_9FIRM|nr:C45 family peptidase [Marinisporobacter balticus]TCO77921.1 putative choloylglycine hydrolase [Marinisporobacter balticus]
MKELRGHYIYIEGTNYEVGEILGNLCCDIPMLKERSKFSEGVFTREEEKQMFQMFDKFCPGINEEILGFAEATKIPQGQVIYYLMTYLKPGCSQMAVLPSKTENGHILMARNYEFSDEMEELIICSTRIKGRYAHIGSSIMQFGRGDGMNEHGLAVSQTSAGMPVGNFQFARKPAILGLQFWAVIRSILENCKNVNEAIELAKEIPIAYNINMLVADKHGNAALIESFNGEKAIRKIDANTDEKFICSTNHIHLPELKHYEPKSMKNSISRYELIHDTMNSKNKIGAKDLKKLLSSKYPEGLCCHFYDEFFGTLRGMIFDLNEGTIEVCFGSTALNEWHMFRMNEIANKTEYIAKIEKEKSPSSFWEYI